MINRFKKKTVQSGNRYNNTVVIYDSIKFRSRLEVFTYKKVKELGLDIKYEPIKFVIFEGFVTDVILYDKTPKKGFHVVPSKINQITYTPDFIVEFDNIYIVIECKGKENDAFPLKEKMFLKQLSTLDCYKDKVLYYLKPRNQQNVLEIVKLIKDLKMNEKET